MGNVMELRHISSVYMYDRHQLWNSVVMYPLFCVFYPRGIALLSEKRLMRILCLRSVGVMQFDEQNVCAKLRARVSLNDLDNSQ